MKSHIWSSFLGVTLVTSILLVRPSTSSAASSWTGNADSFWTNALNWGGNTLPASGADIQFGDTGNQLVELGANQTIGSLTYFSADNYTNNGFTLTLGGNFTQLLNGSVVFNSGLNLGSSARTFANSGSGEVTINGMLTGSGAATFSSGNFTLANAANTNTGGINVNGGRVTLSAPASLALNSASGVSQVGTGPININGGVVRLLPGGAGTVGDIGRTVSFGNSGGSLLYAGNPGNNVALTFNTTGAAGTPATILSGTANIAADGTGWSASAPSINLTGITGSGASRFQLTNGALLRISTSSITNSAITIAGHSGGNAFVGATNTTVGRVLIAGGATNTFGAGLTFQNFNQVTIDGGVAANATFAGGRAIDANLTINSGATAFSGWASAFDSANNLILGLPGTTTRTLTIQNGATAILDQQNRADSPAAVGITPATTFIGGVIVNMPTVIQSNGTLTITRTLSTNNNPGVNVSVSPVQMNRTITGTGTGASVANDAVLNLLVGASGVSFSSNVVVNGGGINGLRVQGLSANVDNFLTTARIQGLTGSGGVLTIAYADNVSRTFSVDPITPSNVRLGLDRQGGSTPTYTLGATTGDLNNWNGIVVKGGTVNVGTAQVFAGALDVTGGALNVNGANLTFNQNANFTGGTISVASLRTLTAGQITAGTGATLTGSGTFNSSGGSANIVRGTISPGTSAGTLRFVGGLSLTNTSILNFELGPEGFVGGGSNDLIQAVGSLTLDGKLNVSALPGFGEGTYTLLTYTGSLTDRTLDINSLPAGWLGSIATTAGQVNLVVTVPEPSTYALMGLGLSVLLLARRARRG